MISEFFTDKINAFDRRKEPYNFGVGFKFCWKFQQTVSKLESPKKDYSNFSKDTIKTYLDFVHLIQSPKMNLSLTLELLQFLHFEGKTLESISDFEGRLATVLYDDIIQMELKTQTKLLVCLIISKFDNYNSKYENHLANTLSIQSIQNASYIWVQLLISILCLILRKNWTHFLRTRVKTNTIFIFEEEFSRWIRSRKRWNARVWSSSPEQETY